jgi:formate/nitrite transporter FocA (FNT family)
VRKPNDSGFESSYRMTGDYSRNELLKSLAAWLMVVIQADQVSNRILSAAVWISLASTDGVSKYVGMFVTISSFVALGFEHSVANMFIIPYVSAVIIY